MFDGLLSSEGSGTGVDETISGLKTNPQIDSSSDLATEAQGILTYNELSGIIIFIAVMTLFAIVGWMLFKISKIAFEPEDSRESKVSKVFETVKKQLGVLLMIVIVLVIYFTYIVTTASV